MGAVGGGGLFVEFCCEEAFECVEVYGLHLAKALHPDSGIAECVWFAVSLPARATVEEILVRPSRP